jgi:hypothetical protein
LDEIHRKRKTDQIKTIHLYKNILTFKILPLHLYNITASYLPAIKDMFKTCDSLMSRHMTVLFTTESDTKWKLYNCFHIKDLKKIELYGVISWISPQQQFFDSAGKCVFVMLNSQQN